MHFFDLVECWGGETEEILDVVGSIYDCAAKCLGSFNRDRSLPDFGTATAIRIRF